MILSNPAKDFFVIAAKNAKKVKISELNSIETDLIFIEEQLLNLPEHEMSRDGLTELQKQIASIRYLIREKKDIYL
jgi:Mg2+ and Co2+ transporter CorA